MVSLLAATAVQGETDSNKAMNIYSVPTNSSTPNPIFNPTLPRSTPAFTRPSIPAIALNSALIPDQTPDPYVIPTPTSSPSPTPTIIPGPTVMPTPTPNPTTTPTPNTTPTPIPTAGSNPDPTITPLSATSNLEAFPDDWGEYSRGYGIIFSSVIPPSQPQIAALDYSVLYNGQPSIRLERYVSGSENITERLIVTG
jgi:hypothetical protein